MARIKHNPGNRPDHFIRSWRKHRELTLEGLAEKIGVTKTALSNVERGKSAYTEPMLKALANALACQPADLIMRDPSKGDAIWSIWERVPECEREQVKQIVGTFATKQAR